jgi:hypothetical protein
MTREHPLVRVGKLIGWVIGLAIACAIEALTTSELEAEKSARGDL